MEWISVKERLPDENIEVLICICEDIVQAYSDGKNWRGSRYVRDHMSDGYVGDSKIIKIGSPHDWVTHWMPLPEPPKNKP